MARILKNTTIMKIEFEVTKCTPSNEGKTFVWTLVYTTLAKVFGIEKTVKRTYYIGGMPSEIPVGTKLSESMDRFEVKEYPFPHPESGEVMMLKWLHVKVA